MKDENMQSSLLIGDTSKAFDGFGADEVAGLEVCANILDAIETAASGDYEKIFIVMAGLEGKLSAVLKGLREANFNAKIILLSQMYEEPEAIELVKLERIADDYLICPVKKEDFGAGDEKQAKKTLSDEQQERVSELEKLAMEDDLTGLKNRRYVWEFSRQILELAKEQDEEVTLLVFDIDNFKHYNDVYGHSAGDEILKQAAVLIKRCCREYDIVGRIGGDEFAVLFCWEMSESKAGEERRTHGSHPKEAMFIAERFRKELNAAELDLLGAEGKGVLAISGGLASFPRDGGTIEELFEKADEALLKAKDSGKNRIYLVGGPEE